MIDLEHLEQRAGQLAASFAGASPFRHVVIDDLFDPASLEELRQEIPDPIEAGINKSRDYVFARNKFEKSGFADFGPRCRELYEELCSPAIARMLSTIAGEEVFVDRDFHGGGVHQGGEGSFLDMHVDFNIHPGHRDWMRNLNVLLYLNQGWEPGWGGRLKLRHKQSGARTEIDPIFGRLVVMETRHFTVHGVDVHRFPAGRYRQSIACYAYSPSVGGAKPRSTIWYPERGRAKQILGRPWPMLVSLKNRFFGSGTARNK